MRWTVSGFSTLAAALAPAGFSAREARGVFMSSYLKYEDNRIPHVEAILSDTRTQHPAVIDDGEIQKLAPGIWSRMGKELSSRLQNQDASHEIYRAGSEAVFEEVTQYRWVGVRLA